MEVSSIVTRTILPRHILYRLNSQESIFDILVEHSETKQLLRYGDMKFYFIFTPRQIMALLRNLGWVGGDGGGGGGGGGGDIYIYIYIYEQSTVR